jgi:hypothetical protein
MSPCREAPPALPAQHGVGERGEVQRLFPVGVCDSGGGGSGGGGRGGGGGGILAPALCPCSAAFSFATPPSSATYAT